MAGRWLMWLSERYAQQCSGKRGRLSIKWVWQAGRTAGVLLATCEGRRAAVVLRCAAYLFYHLDNEMAGCGRIIAV